MRVSSSLLAACAFGFAAASEDQLWARQMQDMSEQVLAGLQGIVGNITGLNNSLNGVSTSGMANFGALLAVQNGGTQTGNAVVNATSAANMSSGPFEQSLEIAAAAVSLQPYLFPLLDNFVARGMVFINNGLGQIVLMTLQTQRMQTQQLGDALASKLAQPYQDEAVPVNEAILRKFDSTITFFMSNGTIPPVVIPQTPSPGANETPRIVAWINKTRDDASLLNDTISGVPDTGTIPLSSLEPLFYQSQNLTADLTNAIGLINQSAPFNINDSNTIAVSILRLQPVVFDLLALFRQKVQAFMTTGQTSIVTNLLGVQSGLTNDLAFALANKLIDPYITEAPILQQKFIEQFNQTIDTFGGPSDTSAAAAEESSTGAAPSLMVTPAYSTIVMGISAAVLASGLFGASLVL